MMLGGERAPKSWGRVIVPGLFVLVATGGLGGADGSPTRECRARVPKFGKAIAFAEPAKTAQFDIPFDCYASGKLLNNSLQEFSPMVHIHTPTLRQSIHMIWHVGKSAMVATIEHVWGKDDPGYHLIKGTWCPGSERALASTCIPFEVVVNVRYIRRGILSTNPDDLERAFKAFRAIKDLHGDEGRKRYGPSYNSFDEVMALHYRAAVGLSGAMSHPDNNNGTGQSCDVAHFASSFPSYHMFLTLLMEKSMQLVDPRVTIPYWNPQGDMHGYTDPASSPTFKLIGPLVGDPKTNYQITTGPFANWTIPSGEYAAELAGGEKYLNAWGLLVAPFNPYNNKFVGRFGNSQRGHHDMWPLPLAVHKSTSLLKGGSLSATQVSPLTSNGFGKAAWHTIPHVSVGGYQGGWDLDAMIEDAGDKVLNMDSAQVKDANEGTKIMAPHPEDCNDCQREIWNAQAATIPTIFPQMAFALGCITCPSGTCSFEQKSDDPTCMCTWNHATCDLNRTVYEFMDKTKLLTPLISDKLRASILRALTDPNPLKNPLLGSVAIAPMGDNTASLNDPWFMLHHAEIDRMFMATQLLFASEQYTPAWRWVGLDKDPTWYSDNPRVTKDGVSWPNAGGPFKSKMNCKGYWYHDLVGGGQFINLLLNDPRWWTFTRYNEVHLDGYTNAEGVNAVYEDRLPYCYDDLTAMGGTKHDGPKYTPEMRGFAMACDGISEESAPVPASQRSMFV